MANTRDLSLDNMKFNVLVVGEPKTGKTTLLGTFSGLVYVFDMDDGIKTLIGQDVQYDTYLESDVMKPTAFKRVQDKMALFEKSARTNGFVEDEGRKVELVALDGSTELLNTIMNYKLFMSGRPGVQPHRDDYGPQMTDYVTFINRLKGLPCHTVVICHEQIVESEHTGIVKTLPAVTGKQTLAPNLGAKFDIVVRSEAKRVGKNTSYQLLTQNQGIHTAGHRFGDAFEQVEEPNLDMLFAKVDAYRARVKTRLDEHAADADA